MSKESYKIEILIKKRGPNKSSSDNSNDNEQQRAAAAPQWQQIMPIEFQIS